MKTIKVVDLFCGAGGTSSGVYQAADLAGIQVDLLAINHWIHAIKSHRYNHKLAHHKCESLDTINPTKEVPEGKVHLLVASPECTHHSNARGGKPRNDQSRCTAYHVCRWADALRIDNILIENVPEFKDWRPLTEDGKPDKRFPKGHSFRPYLETFKGMGYRVEWRILNAANYGAYTSRRRLFIQCRKHRKITWPKPTHDKNGKNGLPKWNAAKDIINWNHPTQSIFDRKSPLKPKTLARIEAGIKKYWGEAAEPFLILLRGTGTAKTLSDPVPGITANGQHHGLVQPFLFHTTHSGADESRCHDIEDPVPTVTGANRGEMGIIEPFVIGCGGRRAQSGPKSVEEPLNTITGKADACLVQPFLVNFQSGKEDSSRRHRPIDKPLNTITCETPIGLVEPFICHCKGTKESDLKNNHESINEPLSTITARDSHALIQPFLSSYYGGSNCSSTVSEPVPTVTTKDRIALVEPRELDICFRMLQPDELQAAMGMDDFVFFGTKGDIVKQIGNAVEVNQARALAKEILKEYESTD